MTDEHQADADDTARQADTASDASGQLPPEGPPASVTPVPVPPVPVESAVPAPGGDVAAQPPPFAPADGLPPVPRRQTREQLPPPEPLQGVPMAPVRRRTAVGRVLALVIAALLIGVLVALAGGWWYLYGRPGRVPAGRTVTVTVRSGDSVSEIAGSLEKAGVVPSALGFELLVRALGAGDSFQSGTYRLKSGTPGDEVIAALEVGHGSEGSVVTIPEGYSVRQIAARLQAKTGISADEFTSMALTQGDSFKAGHAFLASNHTRSLEGFLFPKTYVVDRGATPRQVIDSMLDQFGKETGDLDLSYAHSKNLTLNDVVTIASIIQRESMLTKDQPVVASVLYNRLHAHMRLGLDTTVIYALGLESKAKVYLRDLQVDSPYNTYRNNGLPPGAICNPGIDAIRAAAHPTQTKYLYFIATGSGKLTFSTNAADFQKAKDALSR